jgi:hypothetical protein
MKKLPSNKLYYCEHLVLTPETNEEINAFVVSTHPEGKGLMDYLQQEAVRDEHNGVMRTYFVRDKKTKELAGYFSLRASSLKLELMYDNTQGMYPCVELAYFAMNDIYLEAHQYNKGTGITIFYNIIVPIAQEISESVGAKGIIGYALDIPSLLDRYINDYGFSRLEAKKEEELHKLYRPANDKGCVFIYRDFAS